MRYCVGIGGLALLALGSSIASAADWPQWGGGDCRNMVSQARGLPDFFEPGQKASNGSGIDPATTKNVRWAARLGSAAYGNPTVAGGRVFVGTDDLTVGEDPRFRRTRGGIVKCLDESTGATLWQLVVPERTRLPAGILFGHQHLGICSSPAVEGDRVYLVTCAAEVVCLDVNGQADGNNGPFLDEGQYMAGSDQKALPLKSSDGDILWRFDLIENIGVRPHDAASCSILIHGDLLYLSTSNGVDRPHEKVVAPDAPAIIALDKRTGKLAAVDGERLSSRLYHCQWSSPSLCREGRKTLVLFGGGDGVCYAFEAISRLPEKPVELTTVWSYDCNPPEYRFRWEAHSVLPGRQTEIENSQQERRPIRRPQPDHRHARIRSRSGVRCHRAGPGAWPRQGTAALHRRYANGRYHPHRPHLVL